MTNYEIDTTIDKEFATKLLIPIFKQAREMGESTLYISKNRKYFIKINHIPGSRFYISYAETRNGVFSEQKRTFNETAQLFLCSV